LYVAFDTTALALTLSMILMFGQFLIERFESQLLVLVDQRAKSEIAVQFDMTVSDSSGYEKIANHVVAASRESVEKQTEIWRKSIRAAEQAWVSTLTQANSQVQGGLADALDENVANLAHYLGEAIERADTAMSHRWQQWQVTLSENARLMETHQRQLCEQTEFVHEILTRTAESQPSAAARNETAETPEAATPPVDADQPSRTAAPSLPDSNPNDASLCSIQTIAGESRGNGSVSNPAMETVPQQVIVPQHPAPVEQPEPTTIRFENYQSPSKYNTASSKARSDAADVNMPFRSRSSR
jgi:hypothetical protein